MQALQMLHEIDPRVEIMDAVKPYIDGFEPMGAQVLVGIYVRPNQTRSGIFLSDQSRTEDLHQSKVGLVLKKGPLAFVEDAHHTFGERVPEIGDWVVYRIGDSFPCILGERHVRFIEDVSIKGIIDRPDVVF